MSRMKLITCPICKTVTDVEGPEQNLRSVFPVDSFILGHLLKSFLYDKSETIDPEKYGAGSLKPSGAETVFLSRLRNSNRNNYNRNMDNRPIVVEATTFVSSLSHPETMTGNLFLFKNL